MDDEQLKRLKDRGRRGYCQRKGEPRVSIPDSVMEDVIKRDKVCVYCGQPFGDTRCNMATWEHIDNADNTTENVDKLNIALCCGSCNSSRGKKDLIEWIKTAPRCKREKINIEKVSKSEVIRKYLNNKN